MKFGNKLHHLATLTCLVLASAATAQTTKSAADKMDFGAEGLIFPPIQIVNGHIPRTAQLLGQAYLRREPLVWKRVQLISDLGQVALSAGSPYLVEAMRDPAPEVRAEASRSAGLINDSSLLSQLEKLLTDPDATVRAQAVLSYAHLASPPGSGTSVPLSSFIAPALSDPDPRVLSAAIQAASFPADAELIARKLPSLPPEVKPEAARTLGRLKVKSTASALLPLLNGNVVERTAALRTLEEIADPAQSQAVLDKLADPHPTVRRQAALAMGQLADAQTRHTKSIGLLSDPDDTVRQAAAIVLTPDPSREALAALAKQLDEDYVPLHESLRAAMIHPADPSVRDATIELAAEMLTNPNPRRRQDASYILGHLRSSAALNQHIALLQWNSTNPSETDWPLVAQAAESLGLINDPRAIPALMSLVKPAPEIAMGPLRPKDLPSAIAMADAMSNALVSLARLHHEPALAQAVRILKIDPALCPAPLHAAAAFAIGTLGENKTPHGVNFISIYESQYESKETKFESLKALGNLRDTSSVDKLKTIAESDPTPDLRWIAHWAYQRCAHTQIPYTPPTEKREPPVSIQANPI